MLNGTRLIAFILLSIIPAVSFAIDLSGKWSADDGGTYYLRQIGNKLHWYGEAKASNPAWANIYRGVISNNRVNGDWLDVPKGKTNNSGKLRLDIKANGNILEAFHKTGGFGGSKWTRVGYTPVKPIKPLPGVIGTVVLPVKEDCVSFNPSSAEVTQKQGRWKIVDGSHWVFDFDNKAAEARRAMRIIKRYGINQSCYVGRPGPSFEYLLISGQPPVGKKLAKEDCVAFNNANAKVKKVGARWKIVDGNHMMFDFGNNKKEADTALAIIIPTDSPSLSR